MKTPDAIREQIAYDPLCRQWTYLEQLNHIRKSLIAQHAREQAQDDQLGLAIDHIASAIIALGGTVAEVPGYDCAA